MTGGHVSKALGLDPQELEEALKSHNAYDAVGQGVETGAELAAGEGAITGGAKLLTKIPAIAEGAGAIAAAAPKAVAAAKYIGTAGARAAAGYGVTKAEGGDDKEAATNAAANATMPVLLDALGSAGKWLGGRMLNSKLRLNLGDSKDGARIQTVFDEGVNGLSLKDMAEKVGQKIGDLTQQARDMRGDANPAIAVNFEDIADQAKHELLSDPRNIGKNAGITSAIDTYLEDARKLAAARGATNGQAVFDVPTANEVKSGLGFSGAWERGKVPGGSTPEELAASKLYSLTRQSIEDVTPDKEMGAINARIGS